MYVFYLLIASERVGVPASAPPSPTAESPLVIVISVLGAVIFLVFVPIIIIIIVLTKGQCTAVKLKKELNYTRCA